MPIQYSLTLDVADASDPASRPFLDAVVAKLDGTKVASKLGPGHGEEGWVCVTWRCLAGRRATLVAYSRYRQEIVKQLIDAKLAAVRADLEQAYFRPQGLVAPRLTSLLTKVLDAGQFGRVL